MWQVHERACVAALMSASRDYANSVCAQWTRWLLPVS